MAKKTGKRRRFQKYLKGAVQATLNLGALAALDVVAAPLSDTVNERTWLSSLLASWSLSDFTSLVDDGPIRVGLAHSDYTSAEIEEWIENAGSWNEGDLVNQEIAKRKIRDVGVFRTEDATVDAPAAVATLNEGRPIRTKCGWILLQGQTVTIWAYNQGSSVLTTGSHVIVGGHANLWPK